MSSFFELGLIVRSEDWRCKISVPVLWTYGWKTRQMYVANHVEPAASSWH